MCTKLLLDSCECTVPFLKKMQICAELCWLNSKLEKLRSREKLKFAILPLPVRSYASFIFKLSPFLIHSTARRKIYILIIRLQGRTHLKEVKVERLVGIRSLTPCYWSIASHSPTDVSYCSSLPSSLCKITRKLRGGRDNNSMKYWWTLTWNSP